GWIASPNCTVTAESPSGFTDRITELPPFPQSNGKATIFYISPAHLRLLSPKREIHVRGMENPSKDGGVRWLDPDARPPISGGKPKEDERKEIRAKPLP